MSAAALAGSLDALEYLLKNGGDVNATSRDHNTPLHSAAFLGHYKAVKLLLDKHASINARNRNGETPLDVSASSFDSVFSLIARMNESLRLRLHLPQVRKQRPLVAALLREKGAKPGSEILDIWLAAKSGNL